jgi:hypothetical protein
MALDPELAGQLASIGIVKGKSFSPDAGVKKILTDAVNVGQRNGADSEHESPRIGGVCLLSGVRLGSTGYS